MRSVTEWIQYRQNWPILCDTDDAVPVIEMVIGVEIGGGAPLGRAPKVSTDAFSDSRLGEQWWRAREPSADDANGNRCECGMVVSVTAKMPYTSRRPRATAAKGSWTDWVVIDVVEV